MEHNYRASCDNVSLVPLGHQDIEALRVWRNDSENTRYLRKLPHITREMQEKWFDSYLADPAEFTFAIRENDKLDETVGSLSLYDFEDTSCELGRILVGHPDAHGRKIGLHAVQAALDIAFTQLGLSTVRLHVFEENDRAIHVYQQAGFIEAGSRETPEGRELCFEVDRAGYGLLGCTSISTQTTNKATMVEFPQFGDERGHLVVAEGSSDAIPFEIKRIFYIYGSDHDVVRGQHANRRTEFVLINVAGTSKVKVRDGHGGEEIFVLDRPHIGIYLPTMVWKDMYDFSADSVLLVLASEHYDPDEYIRDYDDFVAELDRIDS